MPKTAAVTVLGLGNMGSEIARILVAAGQAVTIWNRTAERGRDLGKKGAVLAPDAAGAIAASPISVICVERYDQVQGVLEHAAANSLERRSIVNLTWGTASEASELEAWVRSQGATYLDGQIMCYPQDLGTPQAFIICAGDHSLHEQFARVIRPVARSRYLGGSVSLANVLGSATGVIFYHTALGAFLEAAAYAKHYGVDTGAILDLTDDVLGLIARWSRIYAEQFDGASYETNQASNRIHYEAARMAQADIESIGQPATLIRAFSDLIEPLAAPETAELSLAYLYEVLRQDEAGSNR